MDISSLPIVRLKQNGGWIASKGVSSGILHPDKGREEGPLNDSVSLIYSFH